MELLFYTFLSMSSVTITDIPKEFELQGTMRFDQFVKMISLDDNPDFVGPDLQFTDYNDLSDYEKWIYDASLKLSESDFVNI
jgi:hypothetical protein